MIVYPESWSLDYEKYCDCFDSSKVYAKIFLEFLATNLEHVGVRHLAYSGGIDSTILLNMLSIQCGKNKIHTYTIASRNDHPDILFARKGAEHYKSIHHEFIVDPEDNSLYANKGDNAVKQFFDNVSKYTKSILCGDGIDEFMCGYYQHCDESQATYDYFLSKLLPDHLVPLNKNSGNVKVFLPYLEPYIPAFLSLIDLKYKVDDSSRKKLVISAAKLLGIPKEFINRNKYGFCDAFIGKIKECGKK